MTLLACKESESLSRMPKKSLRCMSYEDTLLEMEAFLDGKLDNLQNARDVYVDITETMASSVIRQAESTDLEATENSSSFGYTESRGDYVSETSDAEVESEFRVDDSLASTLDGYDSVFPTRKKKLTTHWRKFIQPLMWRCKWIELKIKELESQALKYSQELEVNKETKLLENTSDFCSKSFPFFNHLGKRRIMKRKKRKRVENMTDIPYYMSHHQLFSYLENKKCDLDGTPAADDDVNQKLHPNDGGSCMDDVWLRNGDDSLEQTLRQIETVQSQVQRLRSQLDMVIFKHGVKFSSYENLSLLAPYDAQTSAVQSPAFSAGNGDNMSVYPPQHLVNSDIGDLGFPKNIISSYEKSAQIPDIIESTVGLLSAAEVPLRQPQLESGENIVNETHIQKREMIDEHVSSREIDRSAEECHGVVKKENNISSVRVSVTGDGGVQEKSISNSYLTSEVQVSKNKGKRGERRAGPGAWTIKSAGEPDSS